MRVNVKLFAILRERAGKAELTLELPVGRRVSDASQMLAEREPQLARFLPRVAYAVNREYASGDTVLNDGDELAVIPPVSGGLP